VTPVIVRTPKGDQLCTNEHQVTDIVLKYLSGAIQGHGSVTIHKVYGTCGWVKFCDHSMRDKSTGIIYCRRGHRKCGNCFPIGGKVVMMRLVRV